MAIKWSPSNQPSNLYWCYDCGCNVHDTGLSILSHKVNQCKCGLPVFTAVSFLPNPRVNIQSTAELIDCRFDEALCLCRGFPNERRVLADKHSWFDVWRAELLPITVSTIIVDRLHNHFAVFDHCFLHFFQVFFWVNPYHYVICWKSLYDIGTTWLRIHQSRCCSNTGWSIKQVLQVTILLMDIALISLVQEII